MPEKDVNGVMEEFVPNVGELSRSIADNAGNPIFKFMPNDQFQHLVTHDRAEAARVYWREILYRAHLAAVTALARHARWIDACRRNYSAGPNFLGLACCLRGLLEGGADTFYSLRAAPLTIANSIRMIRRAVCGHLRTGTYIAEELEHLLIHFLYARRLDGKSQGAFGHRAESTASYVQCLLEANDDSVRRMYDELCSLTHPSASSVLWMLKTSRDFSQLQFGGTNDVRFARQLVDRHAAAIRTVAAIPLDISVCTLRVLNLIPLPEVHVLISEAYEPAGWQRVVPLLQAAGGLPST